MTETINAISITVTAKARTSVPNGSPTRCATTSAWYTAANTVANSTAPAAAAMSSPLPRNSDANRTIQAQTGQVQAHQGVRAAAAMLSQNSNAMRLAWHAGELANSVGLPPCPSAPRLERVVDQVGGDLAAHVVADLERVSEVDAAPDAHVACSSAMSAMLVELSASASGRRYRSR